MAIEELPVFMEAIGRIESGGRYHAMGVPTKGGRALGKYQIMSGNWPNWARLAGIPGADWRDPKAQDHVAGHMMRYYYSKYGSWDAVAVAWFAGEGSANKYVRGDRSVANRRDALGTSVGRYVEKAMLTMAQIGPGQQKFGITKQEHEALQRQQEKEAREKAESEARAAREANHDLMGGGIEMPGVSSSSLEAPAASLVGGQAEQMAARGMNPEMTSEQAVSGLFDFVSDFMRMGGGEAPESLVGGLAQNVAAKGVEATESEELRIKREEEANLQRGREIQEGLDPSLMAARGQAAGGVSGNVFAPKGNWERNQVNAWAGQVAGRFGVRANDSYRSPSHNARVGGAKNSDHLWGGAVDFFGPKANMDKLAAWARQHSGPGKPFRIVLWQVKGHFDHVHISFHRGTNTPAPLP